MLAFLYIFKTFGVNRRRVPYTVIKRGPKKGVYTLVSSGQQNVAGPAYYQAVSISAWWAASLFLFVLNLWRALIREAAWNSNSRRHQCRILRGHRALLASDLIGCVADEAVSLFSSLMRATSLYVYCRSWLCRHRACWLQFLCCAAEKCWLHSPLHGLIPRRMMGHDLAVCAAALERTTSRGD